MPTLTIPNTKKRIKTNNQILKPIGKKLSTIYTEFMDDQQRQHVYWYMKVIIVIPCVYMVLSIMAMAQLTDNFEYFIGFTMLLFYANVSVHIIDLKSRIFIPVYYFSLMLLVLIPLITYLIG